MLRGLTVMLGRGKRSQESAVVVHPPVAAPFDQLRDSANAQPTSPSISALSTKTSDPGPLPTSQAARVVIDSELQTNGASPILNASSLSQRLDEQLRRLTRVVQATNQRQLEVIQQLEAAAAKSPAPSTADALPTTLTNDLTKALANLPAAISANAELPGRTVAALERIESLASTIRSHQQLQRRAADDLTGMREDLRRTLGTMEQAVLELGELHRVSMNHVAELSNSQREMLIGHHRHMAEIAGLRDQIRLELAEEHHARQCELERAQRKNSRRILWAVLVLAAAMVLSAMMTSGAISAMR